MVTYQPQHLTASSVMWGCHRCTVSTHSVLLIVEFGTDGVFTVFLNGLKVRTPRWCIRCDWLIGCD